VISHNNDVVALAVESPITEERPWAVFAACKDKDPDTFFPLTSEAERKAIRICQGCSVQMECLEFALETNARFGVWGGQTEKQRQTLLRQIA
jgi:WhiB family redox-sensing transcriptional regulator